MVFSQNKDVINFFIVAINFPYRYREDDLFCLSKKFPEILCTHDIDKNMESIGVLQSRRAQVKKITIRGRGVVVRELKRNLKYR